MQALSLKNRITKISIVIVFLSSGIFFSNNSFAQSNALTQLKKETTTLNEKEESIKPGDPWTVKNIITPAELVKELKDKGEGKPVILQVGFEFLYNTGHIPGAEYAGPASKPQGLSLIKKAVSNLKKNTNIVIYCGCCPWNHCPNIRPAFKLLKELGYSNVQALVIKQDFGQDWSDKGYPEVKTKE